MRQESCFCASMIIPLHYCHSCVIATLNSDLTKYIQICCSIFLFFLTLFFLPFCFTLISSLYSFSHRANPNYLFPSQSPSLSLLSISSTLPLMIHQLRLIFLLLVNASFTSIAWSTASFYPLQTSPHQKAQPPLYLKNNPNNTKIRKRAKKKKTKKWRKGKNIK